jgi:hypothetical protein
MAAAIAFADLATTVVQLLEAPLCPAATAAAPAGRWKAP